MEQLIIYQGKVSLSIAAFCLLYLLLYRGRKQFRFNRIYLTGSFVLSFIIPLITFTITVPGSGFGFLPEYATVPAGAETQDAAGRFDAKSLLIFAYLAITALFMGTLLTGHLKVIRLLYKSVVRVVNGHRIMVTEKDIQPFTYLNRIVIPSHVLGHPDLPMIVDHEKVHVEGGHSFDILLSEILFFTQWFNPFAWILRKAVRDNLEYLTDQEVANPGNMQQYQMAMVSLAGKSGMVSFLNTLSGNNLKTRIVMMKKKTENRNRLVHQLTVLPLLAVLIPGLSSREYKTVPADSPNPVMQSLTNTAAIHSPGDTVKNNNREIVVTGYKIDQKSQPETVVIGYGKSTGQWTFKKADSLAFRSAGNAGAKPLFILDGTEIKSIEGISPDDIESISVLKNESAVKIYGEKGKHGVVIITSKKTGQPADNVLIILDGKPTEKKVADIHPDDIQSVNVLKGDQAITKYGDLGKNGVIEITSKIPAGSLPGIVTSVDQLRQWITASVHYPKKAMENEETGEIKVYAFVNQEGEITQMTESKPGSGFLKVDEVVVVGYAPQPVRGKSVRNSSALQQEAALQVKKLPTIDIAGFKGNWVEFRFKFILQ